jgi:hypothetical protein
MGVMPMNERELATRNAEYQIADSIRQHIGAYRTLTGAFPTTITVELGAIENRSGVDVPKVTVKIE